MSTIQQTLIPGQMYQEVTSAQGIKEFVPISSNPTFGQQPFSGINTMPGTTTTRVISSGPSTISPLTGITPITSGPVMFANPGQEVIQQVSTCNCGAGQQMANNGFVNSDFRRNNNATGTTGRRGLFRRRNNNTANTTGNAYGNNGLGVLSAGDVTLHSYTQAHREKRSRFGHQRNSTGNMGTGAGTGLGNGGLVHQASCPAYNTGLPNNGLGGGFGSGIGNSRQSLNNGSGNNLGSDQKRHHRFQSLFGRKHHDSGHHVGMLGSGPSGGVGLPSTNNVGYGSSGISNNNGYGNNAMGMGGINGLGNNYGTGLAGNSLGYPATQSVY